MQTKVDQVPPDTEADERHADQELDEHVLGHNVLGKDHHNSHPAGQTTPW